MKTTKALVISIFALLSTGVLANQVLLTLVPDGSVIARPGSGTTVVDRGKSTASARAPGNEDTTSCEVYGRRSSANGQAAVTAPEFASVKALSYRLDAVADASGGHYRTGTCFANRRIGFTGHDTEASVDAVATAVVRIKFEGGRPNVPYFLKISRSQAGSPQVDQLTDPDGKVVPLSGSDTPHPLIFSRPGQAYFLRTTVAAAARNRGGCCNQQATSTSDMSVSVEPAPLLFASQQGGYIAGGSQTESYKNVGVVLLEGLPHCTATLVSPTKLVTAAHCVVGHMTEERLKGGKVLVGFGSVYSQPLFPPIQVERVEYPDSKEMLFDPQTLKHDIAVLSLKSPVSHAGIVPSVLHEGNPTWQQIQSKATKLVFVGFGFNVLNNEKVGLGIKREAAWGISGYDDLAISYSTPGLNTCKGDSGGPGFLEGSKSLILASVTSGGDVACTFGFNTRVDAYLAWLKPKIAP